MARLYIATLAWNPTSVDSFYAEVQAMGGGRGDTSSLIRWLGRK
jgi:hypothetical protein